MQVVLDIETDRLDNPSKVWVIVAKDIQTGELHVFREPTEIPSVRSAFVAFCHRVELYVGHNWLEFDYPVLRRLLGLSIDDVASKSCDTLLLSRLFNFSNPGALVGAGSQGPVSDHSEQTQVLAGLSVAERSHSLESYGKRLGIPKGKFSDFSKFSPEMEEYCRRDVEITFRLFKALEPIFFDRSQRKAILLEQEFQTVINSLQDNGFQFNKPKAERLLAKVTEELSELDGGINDAFRPVLKLVREVHPRLTRYGTLNKGDFRFVKGGDLSEFNGGPFSRLSSIPFNPSSHKQVIEVLHKAGWRPVDKTQAHIEADRNKDLDKLVHLSKYGWKVNEQNLNSLPSSAPGPARLLAKRILLESRRRTLTEWLNLVRLSLKVEKKSIREIIINSGGPKKTENENTTSNLLTECLSKNMIDLLRNKKLNVRFVEENDLWLWITIMPPTASADSFAEDVTHVLDGLKAKGLKYSIISERIHGKYLGCGAWTHRMAHQKPNTANIPNEYDTQGKKKLLGKEMRSLWCAPKNRLLVGVDAEGIQLRIFAHYIDDKEFTDALVRGNKSDKSDPHSLNQRILGSVCRSRAAAKRFIYALLLGAGLWKLSQILECSESECKEALDRLMERYTGFRKLKEETARRDGKRGWFIGLDGRHVAIPGDSDSERKHLAMSGYLQNGEAVVMKKASVYFFNQLPDKVKLVNFVHDEWQTEVPNNMEIALSVAKLQADSLRIVGEELKLKCPLAGSYWSDETNDYTIGTNWSVTH